MAIYRGTGGAGDATNDATVTEVTQQAVNAATSATEAAASATTASTKASEASTSATTASTKASEASTSATNAATSATEAETAKTAAETAQTAAETAQTAAETAETNAETAQTAAETAQTAAETAQTAAETAETNAATSATTATTQATTATTKATEAATSATSAATSATTATTKATEASTSATNAAASATTASTKATEASTSATNAATSATNASTSETNAATSETNASTSATNAATSATNAATSATTATTKASEAATSATSASTSASTATTKASEASASAASALTYKNSAETAKDAALAALDNFDDRYLGQKTSDPTVDNDGDALVAGALYFNTTDDVMKVYEGSTWVAAYASLSGALLSANNLSDLDNASSARTNLGLGTAATTASTAYATAAQGTTADSAMQDLVDDTTPQLGGDLDTNGNDVNFGDNDKAQFGAGNDLQIYHDGSNSRILESGTGSLKIGAADLELSNVGGYKWFKGVDGAQAELYHNNSKKLATTSTGVDVTGTVTADNVYIASTLRHEGDTDTYLYFPSAGNNIGLTTGGTERMRIDSSGNVGIGETSPDARLHVVKSTNDTTAIKVSNTNAGTLARASLQLQGGGDGFIHATSANYSGVSSWTDSLVVVSSSNLSGGVVINAQTGGITFQDGTTERMRIVNGGDVVINENGQDRNFRVESDTNTHMLFVDAGLSTVGIGKSNPGTTLDVEGSFRAKSAFPAYSLSTGTGNNQNYWKLGRITFDGSETLKIRLQGTWSYSAGSYIAGETTILFRASNGTTTTEGTYWSETSGNAHLQDVVWKNISSNTFDIYVRWASTYAGTDMFVETSGTWSQGVSDTGSTTAPSGSTSVSSRKSLFVANRPAMFANTSQVVFNDSGYDMDFRVESDTNANAVFLDASSNHLNFGRNDTSFASANVYIANLGTSNTHLAIATTTSGITNANLYLNRQSSDGHYIQFRRGSSTTVGSIGVDSSNNMYIESSSSQHTGLTFPDDAVVPRKGGSNNNGATDLGATSVRWRTMYTTRGIQSESADTGWTSLNHKKSGSVNLFIANYGTNMTIRDTQKTNQPGFNFVNSAVIPAGGSMFYGSSNGVLDFGASGNQWKGGYFRNLYTATTGNTTTMEAFGVRAWANFRGSSTVSVRDTGNISSVTDRGVGKYRLNFTNAMPDNDYAVSCTSGSEGTATPNLTAGQVTNMNTTYCEIWFRYHGNGGYYDGDVITAMVVR